MRLQPVAQQFTRRWIQSLHSWPLLSSSPAPLPLKLTPIHPPGLEGALCTPRGSFTHVRLSTACPVLRLPCLSVLFCKPLQAKVIRSVLVVVSWAWKTGEMVAINDYKWVPLSLGFCCCCLVSGHRQSPLSSSICSKVWFHILLLRWVFLGVCLKEFLPKWSRSWVGPWILWVILT